MRTLAALIAIIVAASAWARGPTLETIDEARQRHSAERYEVYRQNGSQAPLGGYRETLGDPAPYGTERPGYTSPQDYGQDRGYGQDTYDRDRW